MQRNIKVSLFKLNIFLILSIFIVNQLLSPSLAAAQSVFNLPSSSTMIFLSENYAPALLKGIKINLNDPLKLDFVMDLGASSFSESQQNEESIKLIKYFLASLAIPNQDLWVNLSPYEKDKIIPLEFGQTEMGRDLLAQDYILKQIMASLMYPENELGKAFWERIYAKAQEQYGTTDIPLNTFNKVWIIPDKAVVYENEDTAFIVESHLKVMLEGDYVALNKGVKDMSAFPENVEKATEVSDLSAAMVREIILPELEKEVNEGRNFVALRQIYSSLVLATWYKRALKDSLLGKIYIEKKKIDGVQVDDKEIKQKIYSQYLDAFKNGLYNYMKDEYDPVSQTVIPRKYFSGGVLASKVDGAMTVTKNTRNLDKIDHAMLISAKLRLGNVLPGVLKSRSSEKMSEVVEYNYGILKSSQFLEKLKDESMGFAGTQIRSMNVVLDQSGRIIVDPNSGEAGLGNYNSEETKQKLRNKEYYLVTVTVKGNEGNLTFSINFVQDGLIQMSSQGEILERLVDALNMLNQEVDPDITLIPKPNGEFFEKIKANSLNVVDPNRVLKPFRRPIKQERKQRTLLPGEVRVQEKEGGKLTQNFKGKIAFTTDEDEPNFYYSIEVIDGTWKIQQHVYTTGEVLPSLKVKVQRFELGKMYSFGRSQDRVIEVPSFDNKISGKHASIQIDRDSDKGDFLITIIDGELDQSGNLIKPSSFGTVLMTDYDGKKPDNLGGIDFNPDQLNIEKRGEGVKFNVNLPEELRNIDADSIKGITPVILQIVPITNLPIFLGVNDQPKEQEVSYL